MAQLKIHSGKWLMNYYARANIKSLLVQFFLLVQQVARGKKNSLLIIIISFPIFLFLFLLWWLLFQRFFLHTKSVIICTVLQKRVFFISNETKPTCWKKNTLVNQLCIEKPSITHQINMIHSHFGQMNKRCDQMNRNNHQNWVN